MINDETINDETINDETKETIMQRLDSFLTTRYKCGLVHSHYCNHKLVVQVQVDRYAYSIYVKSYHAAKILITKWQNKTKAD